MSMTTPPGWYPDANTPATERWWDGTAWTAHSRAAQASGPVPQAKPVLAQGQPQAPGQTHVPGQPYGGDGGAAGGFGPPTVPAQRSGSGTGSTGGAGGSRTVALATAGVVLVAVVAVGAVLLNRGDGTTPEARPASGSPTAPKTAGPEQSASASPSASEAATELVDQLNGITMPIPEGWEKSTSSFEHGTVMYTDQTYDCPGNGDPVCRHGQVSSATASQSDGKSAEAVAKKDIEQAVDDAYGEDSFGERIHGGITSHTVLTSQNFAVAGRTGYLVRWRVVTGKGPGGYVQSLVFPSPVGTGALVTVRFAFDAGPDAPGLELMDKIAAGIRPIGDATSGGVGSSIGPG
ncbi:DUF2510 domain-containing protein [Streptomyces sp. NPDC002889]|uniref:DUF2510 domain-containing protein n=1 Tax=Streptomyces sp. NPDC002889 TaxID=3364669 RepID=UPI0036CF1505